MATKITEAHEQGYTAYLDMKTKNPYNTRTEKTAYDEWGEGWNIAHFTHMVEQRLKGK